MFDHRNDMIRFRQRTAVPSLETRQFRWGGPVLVFTCGELPGRRREPSMESTAYRAWILNVALWIHHRLLRLMAWSRAKLFLSALQVTYHSECAFPLLQDVPVSCNERSRRDVKSTSFRILSAVRYRLVSCYRECCRVRGDWATLNLAKITLKSFPINMPVAGHGRRLDRRLSFSKRSILNNPSALRNLADIPITSPNHETESCLVQRINQNLIKSTRRLP